MENEIDKAEIWQRIINHSDDEFHQIRGKAFSYDVDGDYISLKSTNQKIPKKQIFEAILLAPLDSTTPVQHLRAPSYIYAILMDKRIRQNDW